MSLRSPTESEKEGFTSTRTTPVPVFSKENVLDAETALRTLLTQDDLWLRVAAIWEIGRRKLGNFTQELTQFIDSDEALVREAAKAAAERI